MRLSGWRRDLKPENLLIDIAGYLKITDFGFAKRIPGSGRSHTLCGTPEYLAPELVTQSGHGRAVDWWAVGVLIYEMVAGMPPFHQEDRVAMFRAICTTQYTMPAHFSKVGGRGGARALQRAHFGGGEKLCGRLLPLHGPTAYMAAWRCTKMRLCSDQRV